MFRKDLSRKLRRWPERGDRMVLMMDANEDAVDGVRCRKLGSREIGMQEAVYITTGVKGPNTYFKGALAIDRI